MQVVPLDGFSDPPYLNIDASGVGLGYTLAIPNVGIGVFSLQNLSLSAGFYLPFVDKPANVCLAFCTRENPGQVLVSLFGGGVFFAITLDTKGVQNVEMALEFGAGISLNLGVASGSVTVMGGVYFQKSGDAVLFSAYIRMVGKVSVLGLISVTVEFYLALEYLVDQDKLFGIAASEGQGEDRLLQQDGDAGGAPGVQRLRPHLPCRRWRCPTGRPTATPTETEP